jgi:CheY-like chemotaxis protein
MARPTGDGGTVAESRTQGGPPEAFIKQVKDALEHLYDFPYLQKHPLAREGVLIADRPGEAPSERLRRHLLAAIETLNPGHNVPFGAPHARIYNLLHLHYVEGMTVQEAAHELGVSRRQAHRNLQRGTESVAIALWTRHCATPAPQPPDREPVSSARAEIARLGTHLSSTDMGSLLQGALAVVEQLARLRGVHLCLETPEEPVVIPVDPVIARQVLVNTLSHAVGQALPGPLHLILSAQGERVSIVLRYTPGPEAIHTTVVNPVIAQLADRLGWKVRQEDQRDGLRTVTMLTARRPMVLVIDDNEGLAELLKDSLAGQSCDVAAALTGQEGLRLARKLGPETIVLDVMMPGIDGWEILQRLRNHPQTATVPVIVCSVINNPDLAYSLGASLYLPKPVSREDVLKALRQLGVI